ncbi:MAG TPA: Crp/Fnr family transcriptional regulator [Bacteroidales bacterium]|nr:Crp/Fnr family transcriptional regulator [Bacteroidales bacterium]
MLQPCSNNCSFCFVQYTNVMSNENLFRGIDKEDIGEIIRNVHHQVRSYEAAEIIIHEEEEYNSLLILVQGTVSTEMMNPDGQVLMLEQLEAPATLAPGSLFASHPQIPVSVVAQNNCRALLISRNSMNQILATNPKVLTNFMEILSNRIQFLSNRLKSLQFQSLRSKFAQHILQMNTIQKSLNVTLQKTQQELSELFGVARPSLARVIREMHNEGLIHAQGKHITILNIESLRRTK